MIRLLSAAGVTLLALVSFGLYNGVYAVKAHERVLQDLTAQIAKEAEAIRALKAEWSYLNQPDRLQTLARKHLALAPTSPNQIVVLASLPQRAEAWSNETAVMQLNDLPRRDTGPAPLPPKPEGHAH